MATGSGHVATQPVRPSSPFLLGSQVRSDGPVARLKPHQAIARWICAEARKSVAADATLVFDRVQIAEALGFRLVRVKRSLALHSLSGVLQCRADQVVVLEWVRLCAVARIEPAELGIRPVEQIEAEDLLVVHLLFVETNPVPVKTAAGEPACFV